MVANKKEQGCPYKLNEGNLWMAEKTHSWTMPVTRRLSWTRQNGRGVQGCSGRVVLIVLGSCAPESQNLEIARSSILNKASRSNTFRWTWSDIMVPFKRTTLTFKVIHKKKKISIAINRMHLQTWENHFNFHATKCCKTRLVILILILRLKWNKLCVPRLLVFSLFGHWDKS